MINDKNIEFGALKVFSVVAESETLTAAANRLGITQSAVSQTIKQLESHTGAQLVVRSTRPIKLTTSGEILNDYAQQILEHTRSMLADIQMQSEHHLRQLNIGMIDSFADIAGEQLIRAISNLASRISLRTGLASPLTDALLHRDIDILISSDSFEEHADIYTLPLLRDPFVLLANSEHWESGDKTADWLAANVPFIHYSRATRIGRLVDVVARRLHLQLNTQFELDSTQTLLRFVQAGHGWAIVTGLGLARYPQLLTGCHIAPINRGAHARYLTLQYRDEDLGGRPTKIARLCRTLFDDEVVPQLCERAPWMKEEAYSITEMPLI